MIITRDKVLNNSDPVYDDAEINRIRTEWISEGAEVDAFTQNLDIMYELFVLDSNVNEDFSAYSQEDINSAVNGWIDNEHNYVVDKTEIRRIGDMPFLIIEDTYDNDNGEHRDERVYFFSENNKIYGFWINCRDLSYIDNNESTINKIVESITIYKSAPAQADNIDYTANIPNSYDSSTSNNGVYRIGDTWTVPGQWALTVTSVEETSFRNEYSDRKPEAVYYIYFTYENLGYQEDDGYGLFMSIDNESIVDNQGEMGYEYPGDIMVFPQETPVGARCPGQGCVGVNHAGDFKIIYTKYDDTYDEKHTATFELSVN